MYNAKCNAGYNSMYLHFKQRTLLKILNTTAMHTALEEYMMERTHISD